MMVIDNTVLHFMRDYILRKHLQAVCCSDRSPLQVQLVYLWRVLECTLASVQKQSRFVVGIIRRQFHVVAGRQIQPEIKLAWRD